MDSLHLELWDMITEFLGGESSYMNVVLPFVSKDWAAYIKSKRIKKKSLQPPLSKNHERLLPISLRRRGGRLQMKRSQTKFAATLAREGHLNLLKWAYSQGLFHFNARVCSAAAREGHLHILEWIRSLGLKHFRFDARTCGAAAASGRLDIVEWLINQCGCRYKVVFLRDAARMGHAHVLKWAMAREETFEDTAWKHTVLPGVVEGGHLGLIQQIHSNYTSLVMDSGGFLLAAAGRTAQRHILEWLLGLYTDDDYYWPRWVQSVCAWAAGAGQLDLLRDYLFPKIGNDQMMYNMMCAASKHGQLHVLKWIESLGKVEQDIWYNAAHSKVADWDFIKYAVEELEKNDKKSNVPHSSINHSALKRGNIEMLEWLLARGYPFDGNYSTAFEIMLPYRARVLEWMVEKVPSERTLIAYTFYQAADTGDLNLLEWVKELGCPFDDESYVCATRKGYLHVIEWLHKNGCPVDKDKIVRAAITGKRLAILQWANKNGYLPGNVEGGKKYWEYGYCHPVVLRWVQKNGFLLPLGMARSAAVNGELDILKWLKEHAKEMTWDKAVWDEIYGSAYPHVISWGISQPDCTWDKEVAQKRYDNMSWPDYY